MRTIIVLLCIAIYSSCAEAYVNSYMLDRHIKTCKLNKDIVKSLILTESSFESTSMHWDRTHSFSYGLMQIKYNTAKEVGFSGTSFELIDEEINLKYGIKYLNYLYKKFNGNTYMILDAYNRGPNNVRKNPYRGDWNKHPYVGKILKNLKNKKIKLEQLQCK